MGERAYPDRSHPAAQVSCLAFFQTRRPFSFPFGPTVFFQWIGLSQIVRRLANQPPELDGRLLVFPLSQVSAREVPAPVDACSPAPGAGSTQKESGGRW